jgi:hypothetical protein
VRVCPTIWPNGEHRKGIVGTASDYCPAHDPAREDAPPESRIQGREEQAGHGT